MTDTEKTALEELRRFAPIAGAHVLKMTKQAQVICDPQVDQWISEASKLTDCIRDYANQQLLKISTE